MAVDPARFAIPSIPTADLGRRSTPEEAAKGFEGLILRQLLDELPLPDSGPAGGVLADLVRQAVADALVADGGLGLADQLVGHLGTGRRPSPPVPPSRPSGGRAGRVTSGFGARRDPFDGSVRVHHGLDLAAPRGAAIFAARPGVVKFAGRSGGYGNVVVVDHGGGLETRYAHCDRLDVHTGDPVRAGQPIAAVGSTGRSTGPHLHLEVRRNGTPVDPGDVIDPQDVLAPIRQGGEDSPGRR